MSPGRILVTLEAHPLARSAVDAAADMAARLQAELVALVVEDIQLLHFAAMPFAREVGHASAHRRELDVATMERSLRRLAADAERWLAIAAARAPMQWSLRVTRGARVAEIVAAAHDADLIVTGDTAILLCSHCRDADDWEREARKVLEQAGQRRGLRLLRAGDAADLQALLKHQL